MSPSVYTGSNLGNDRPCPVCRVGVLFVEKNEVYIANRAVVENLVDAVPMGDLLRCRVCDERIVAGFNGPALRDALLEAYPVKGNPTVASRWARS